MSNGTKLSPLRQVLRLRKRIVVWSLFITAMLNVVRSLHPLFAGYAIDWGITAKNHQVLTLLIFIFAGARVAAAGLFYGQNLLFGKLTESLRGDLRLELYKKLQVADVASYENTSKGEIITLFSADVSLVINNYIEFVRTGIGDLLILLATISILFWQDWQLSFIIGLSIPYLFLLRLLQSKFKHVLKRVRSAQSSLSSFLQEHLAGVPTIRSLLCEERTIQKFAQLNRAYKRTVMRQHLWNCLLTIVTETAFTIVVLLVLLFGAFRVTTSQDILTVGGYIVFIMYLQQLLHPVRSITDHFQILMTATVAADRIVRFIEHPVKTGASAVQYSGRQVRGTVEFEHVWFAYIGDNWVLKDLSFKIDAGESAAIVGRTGAGKTTIISLLLRFYEIQKGRILLDGIDLRNWNIEELRRYCSVVFQEPLLFRDTVANNIRVGNPSAIDEQLQPSALPAPIGAVIEQMPNGLRTMVGKPGSDLPAGQKQIVSIARAAVKDGKIFLFDEPASIIDSGSYQSIDEIIRHTAGQNTSIIIAHRLSAVRNAEHIIVLKDGRVCEEGTHHDLFSVRGHYWQLYRHESLESQPVLVSN